MVGRMINFLATGVGLPFSHPPVRQTLKGGLKKAQKWPSISDISNCQILDMTDHLQALVQQMKIK